MAKLTVLTLCIIISSIRVSLTYCTAIRVHMLSTQIIVIVILIQTRATHAHACPDLIASFLLLYHCECYFLDILSVSFIYISLGLACTLLCFT